MNTLRLNGKEKIKCPSCYEELTTRIYQRIAGEWNPDQPDLAKRDYYLLFSIMTDYNGKPIVRSDQNEQTIWNAVSWFIDQPFEFSQELPKVLQIGKKIVSVPRKSGTLSIGQNVMLRGELQKSKSIVECLAITAAIFLQPLYDESKFDVDRAKELEKIILEMPVYLIYPVSFFSLRTARIHGQRPTNVWHLIRSSLSMNLRTMLQPWQRSTNLKNLMISQ